MAKKGGSGPGDEAAPAVFYGKVGLLLEVAVVETLEALAVTGLVLGHLVDGVVDGVEVEFLGAACDAHLVLVGACLGGHALQKVSESKDSSVTSISKLVGIAKAENTDIVLLLQEHFSVVEVAV